MYIKLLRPKYILFSQEEDNDYDDDGTVYYTFDRHTFFFLYFYLCVHYENVVYIIRQIKN